MNSAFAKSPLEKIEQKARDRFKIQQFTVRKDTLTESQTKTKKPASAKPPISSA
jgi:hypothetical protein